MTKEINEYLVQFSGQINVPEALDPDNYVLIQGEFDFSVISDKPTQDGKIDRTYKIIPLRLETRQGDNRLVGKPKRRGSQRLRGALWHYYQTLQSPAEFEAYYDSVINKLIVQLPEVLNYLGE